MSIVEGPFQNIVAVEGSGEDGEHLGPGAGALATTMLHYDHRVPVWLGYSVGVDPETQAPLAFCEVSGGWRPVWGTTEKDEHTLIAEAASAYEFFGAVGPPPYTFVRLLSGTSMIAGVTVGGRRVRFLEISYVRGVDNDFDTALWFSRAAVREGDEVTVSTWRPYPEYHPLLRFAPVSPTRITVPREQGAAVMQRELDLLVSQAKDLVSPEGTTLSLVEIPGARESAGLQVATRLTLDMKPQRERTFLWVGRAYATFEYARENGIYRFPAMRSYAGVTVGGIQRQAVGRYLTGTGGQPPFLSKRPTDEGRIEGHHDLYLLTRGEHADPGVSDERIADEFFSKSIPTLRIEFSGTSGHLVVEVDACTRQGRPLGRREWRFDIYIKGALEGYFGNRMRRFENLSVDAFSSQTESWDYAANWGATSVAVWYTLTADDVIP